MTEAIGTKIVELCAGITKVYLSEAEVNDYPYVVYSQNVTPRFTKDGVYKLVSEALVEVVSNDFDEADPLADSVASAIENGMTGEFTCRKGLVAKVCVNQVWTISLNYTITQKSDIQNSNNNG